MAADVPKHQVNPQLLPATFFGLKWRNRSTEFIGCTEPEE